MQVYTKAVCRKAAHSESAGLSTAMSPPSRAAVELPPVEGGHLRVEGSTLRAAKALGFGALVLRQGAG